MAKHIERPRSACALSGALAAISALPEVIPIIHTSLGCGGNLSGSASFGSGYFGSGYCSGSSAPSSGITETEIVFGGVDRLREEIASTLELINGNLFIVATGCMTEMIGDDVFGVVGEFAGSEKPVIAVNTPSFKGDSYAGYEIVLEGIFNRYLPPAKEKEKDLINIFGIVPAYDPFFRGDLEEIARLANRLGLRVNTFFTPDQTFENITSAPKAALNIVFSRTWAADFARHFQERHGTPYWVTDLPIGAEATDSFLLSLAEKIGVPKKTAEALIKNENKEYYGYFERTADLYCDGDLRYYTVTATNTNYAIPAQNFLQRELGWVSLEAFVTDNLNDSQRERFQAAYREAGLDAALIFETDAGRIAKTITHLHPENRGQRYFDDCSPLYILGSSLEKETAVKRKANQLSISFPVYNRVIMDRGYAGYRGGLHLFEDLLSVLVSPR
jgi:nitrogenase molybdenum-iron protein beta chain